MSRVMLIFPPGWSLTAGGPHVALPLIAGYLKKHGHHVTIRDCNLDSASYYRVRLTTSIHGSIVDTESLEKMNELYYKAEESLNSQAEKYNVRWNVQLGPNYRDVSIDSSESCLTASETMSPFTGYFTEQVLPDIARYDPILIGINVASRFQLIPTLELCRLIKRDLPNIKIVLGGNTVTRLYEDMKLPRLFNIVDYIARYQGEITMLKLCDFLDKRTPLDSVPNIAFATMGNIQDTYISNGIVVDEVPSPDFSGLPYPYWGERYLPLLAGRGCYYGKCYFCAIPYGWGDHGFAGKRADELVYADLKKCVYDCRIRNFKFVDEAMAPSTMRFLARRIKEEGLKVNWEAYTRLEKCWLDPNFVKALSEGGFRKAYFGLELIPGTGRSLMGKRDCCNPNDIMSICHDHGIRIHYFTMLGFPGTTVSDAHDTIGFVLDNRKYIDTCDVFGFGYARHTSVAGIRPIITTDTDWALEYKYEAIDGLSLNSEEVDEMARYYEDIVFAECPRLVHPIYRLFSPWHEMQKV